MEEEIGVKLSSLCFDAFASCWGTWGWCLDVVLLTSMARAMPTKIDKALMILNNQRIASLCCHLVFNSLELVDGGGETC